MLSVLYAALISAAGATGADNAVFGNTVEVSVVNLDVAVSSIWHRPVTDLTAADFEVFEDGESRPISSFTRYVEGRKRIPAGDSPDSAPEAAMPPAIQRSIVFAFDPMLLVAEELATSPVFGARHGTLPLALEIRSSEVGHNGDDRSVEAVARVCADTLVVVPTADGPAADVELLVAVHDEDGNLLGIEQRHERVVVDDPALDMVELNLRAHIPAAQATLSVAVYDRAADTYGLAGARPPSGSVAGG